MDGTENAFARLWALGYRRLVPIIPPDAEISPNSLLAKRVGTHQDGRGKTPGLKGSQGWYSFDWTSYEADELDTQRWHRMGAGIGVKTGDLGNGTALVLIDADTLDPQLAKIIGDAIERELGLLPVRFGNRPKAGYVALVRGSFPYARIEFGEPKERVEILSDGRQFVAHGIHPKTGKPYQWPAGVPNIDAIPILEPSQLTQFLEHLRTLLPKTSEVVREGASAADVNQDALKGERSLIRKAVEATPNTTDAFPSRESYLALGYALKASLPDDEQEAFGLFQDWCDRWQDPDGNHNDPDIVAADWKRMRPPFKRGASFIYETAEKLSGGKFSRAEQWFEPISDNAPLFPPAEDDGFVANKLAFTPFDKAADLATSASTLPLIKGFLDQGAMSVLYGESNTGKTFVAMDIAAHIAAGLPWAKFKTTRFAVVYVAAEGGAGARKRAAALRAKYPSADFLNFHFLLMPVNLLRPDADLGPLIAAIRALGIDVGLVVIDTLSRAMAGGDENASTDMGAMVRHLDAIRAATGAHLMTVHHSGKDRAKGARGHSLLRAATDTEIEIADRTLAVTKQRDLDKEYQSAFSLDVVTLGVDADGDAITSCTVRLMSDADVAAEVPTVREPTATERLVLDALEAVAAVRDDQSGTWAGASAAELTGALFTMDVVMALESVKKHVSALIGKQHLERSGRGRFKRKLDKTSDKSAGIREEIRSSRFGSETNVFE